MRALGAVAERKWIHLGAESGLHSYVTVHMRRHSQSALGIGEDKDEPRAALTPETLPLRGSRV